LTKNGLTLGTRHALASLSNLELLALQAEMALDDRGRLARTWGVTLAVTGEGQRLFAGDKIPDPLMAEMVDAVDGSRLPTSPDREPSALGVCRAILAPVVGPLALEAGPSYVFESDVRFETRNLIVRSDATAGEFLRPLNPGNWEHDEWDELLDGTLGPWAIALAEDKVVSICHTPRRMTARAAECGVWTDPDFRGQGYAAAVTAAWADILRPSGRYLFYSTDAENRSSQRVAARLRLRLIGWTWRLTSANLERDSHRHELSRRSP
jgi:RimJ/RimL family protein N-acetyltransferase